MTSTRPFPPPSVHRCPDCDGPVAAGRCSACGLDLRQPPAATLWWIDNELARLWSQRGAVLAQLRTASRVAASGVANGAANSPPEGPASFAHGCSEAGAPASESTPPVAPRPSTPPRPAFPLSQPGVAATPSVELQNLLLGLGTFSLVVAALVFATVTWTRLSAAVQGSILLGLTAVAVAATTALHRRGLRSTAEAIGVVTVVLGLVDGRVAQVAGFPHVRGQLYWSGALGVVALGGWAFGRLAGVRSGPLAALALAQLSAPLAATVHHPFSLDLFAAVVVVQAAVLLAVWRTGTLTEVEWPVRIGVPVAWATGTSLVLGRLLAAGAHPAFADVAGPAAVTLLAAGVAGSVARWWSDRDGVREPALATLTVLGLAAAVGLAHVGWAGQALAAAAGTAAVLVLILTTRLPVRWGAAPAAVAGAVLGAAALAVLASAGTLTPTVPGGSWPLPTNLSAVVLLAQAGVVLVLMRPDRSGPAAWPARTGALVAWSAALLVAVAGLLTGQPTWPALAAPAGVTAFAAGLAVATAWWWRERADVRVAASAAATAVGMTAVVGALHAWLAGDRLALTAGALAVVVLAGATRLSRRWGDAPAVIGVSALGVATSFGFERLMLALVAPFVRSGHVWSAHADTGVRSLVEPAGIGWGGVALYVVPLAAGLAVAAHRLRPPARAGCAAAIAGLAASVAPLLVGASVAVAVAWLLSVATAAATWATVLGLRRRSATGPAGGTAEPAPGVVAPPAPSGIAATSMGPADGTLATRMATSAADALAAWSASGWAAWSALGWALLVPGATIAVLAVVATTAGAVAAAALRFQCRGLDLAAASVATASAAALAPVVLRAGGWTVGSAWLGLALTACALSAAGWLVEAAVRRSGGSPGSPPATDVAHLRSEVAIAIELSCAAAGLLGACGVVAAGSADQTSVVLLATSLSLASHATRPGRRFLAALAAAGGLALLWQRLVLGGVSTAEAYTLPLAAVLLTAGALIHRYRPDRSTWTTFGPGLVAATAPTVVLALGDAGLVRPLGALAAGAVLVLAGASKRWQAPVGVGAAVVVVVGLQQMAPLVGHLPRWISFGVAGIMLLSVGATYERRRTELTELRRRIASLR